MLIPMSDRNTNRFKVLQDVRERPPSSDYLSDSRYRRDCLGELVQIGGSHHDWFEGSSPKCCL